MSTFQPGLEPPDDWRHQPPPPIPGPTPTTTKAAFLVWLSSVMGMILSSCCIFLAVGVSIVPKDELLKQLPPETYDDQVIQMLPEIAVAMGLFGVVMLFIPAVVLAVLGFKVRSGSRGGTIAAMVVLGIQGLSLALILLVSLLQLLINFTINGFSIIPVEAVGLLIIGVTMVSLLKALAEQRTGAGHSSRIEPWSQ